MENQALCVDIPQCDTTTTNNSVEHNNNNNNNNNINNNNNNNDESYQIASPEDDFYKEWGMEMDGAHDDLASVFLDLQDFVAIGEQCGIGGGGSGEEAAKRARGRPRIGDDLTDSVNESRKPVMSADKLDELRVVDPKRAKRILANRQSAARSKERKARYLAELERRIRVLQVETTNLNAQLRIYQRDTSGLTTENAELKIRLQVMEQQAQMRSSQNEALRHEVERLKAAMGEMRAPMASPTPLNFSPQPSPSTMQTISYSPEICSPHSRNNNKNIFSSPSSLNFSPQPSPSTMQTVSYSPEICSPSSRNNKNMFSFPNQLVPMLSAPPPLRFSRLVPEQSDSLGRLQNFENISNNNSSNNILKMEGNS